MFINDLYISTTYLFSGVPCMSINMYPGLPISDDICKYYSSNGFDILSYYIIDGVIISPSEYYGLKIRYFTQYVDRVVFVTDEGVIEISKPEVFIIEKEELRTILRVERMDPGLIVIFDTIPKINPDYIVATATWICRDSRIPVN